MNKREAYQLIPFYDVLLLEGSSEGTKINAMVARQAEKNDVLAILFKALKEIIVK